jgi:hypothetical protein
VIPFWPVCAREGCNTLMERWQLQSRCRFCSRSCASQVVRPKRFTESEVDARYQRGRGYVTRRRRVLLEQRKRITNQLEGMRNGTE